MSFAELSRAALDELSGVVRETNPAAVERLVAAVLAAPRVFVAGAGRSGLMGRAFAMRLMHAGLTAHVVGDATTPSLQAGDLLLVASGSGETASLRAMAEKARQLGARLALVTIVPGSSIGRLAEVVVHLDAPSPKARLAPGAPAPRRSSLPMGSLFEQALLVLLDVVAALVAEARGQRPEEMFSPPRQPRVSARSSPLSPGGRG